MMPFEKILKSDVEIYRELYSRQKRKRDEWYEKLHAVSEEFDPLNLKRKKERMKDIAERAEFESGWTGALETSLSTLEKLWACYQAEKESNGE